MELKLIQAMVKVLARQIQWQAKIKKMKYLLIIFLFQPQLSPIHHMKALNLLSVMKVMSFWLLVCSLWWNLFQRIPAADFIHVEIWIITKKDKKNLNKDIEN